MVLRFLIACWLISTAGIVGLSAQTAELPNIYDFLTQEEGQKLTLETDLTTLMSDRRTKEYIPGLITLEDGQSFPLKIRPRGKYRRKICEIPPLKLKFSNKMLTEAGFDTLNEIKLVIPCMDSNQGDNLIVKEYLVYRMFERLSSASCRARLVRMTIKDNHVERTKRQVICLLLEDKEQVCKRLNAYEIEQYGIHPDSLHMNQAALVAMFQYMIGNTDWDISMMRNVYLLKGDAASKTLVVPYDFDFSGFVSAPYASPSSESGLRTVRDRFLMANGIDESAMHRAVQVLDAAKKDLMDLCKNKYLSKDNSIQLMEYLDSFYRNIDPSGNVPTVMPMSIDE